ncbi:FUSC family protein [Campylobacter hyointestinalis]|uniref:FUSC family protein n=1 Tax=Campylobacter hyointestinalis TaxID=198 RepID=UPI0007244264|nr:FUSC family protein [Campylobacter hyointestinalis]CUU81516.1 FlhB domain-containing protein [Campylobacter hyointestinalis subsp. hyointestinalis]
MWLYKFIKTYDPANFGLTYALKASISMLLCGILSYYFFGIDGAIFATNASMSIFFINSLDGTNFTKLKYLYLYIAISALFLPFVKIAYDIGWLLIVPTFIWMFFVGISSLFNQNLNKALSIANITGLVALIVQSSGYFELQNSLFGLVLGGFIASFMRTLHIGTYGKFTKKTYNLLLDDVIKMSKNLFDTKEFDGLTTKCGDHIDAIKKIFANKSASIKDERIIIHHSKSIFYLYKIEDIFHSLISLKRYFIKIKDDKLLKDVQNEIILNLTELKNIFQDKKVNITKNAFETVKQSNFSIFAASLSVLYNKFKLIKDGGEDNIVLDKKPKKSLKQIYKEINFKNDTVRNSFRLTLSVAIAILIAELTKIDHGVWIAIGVLSVSRASSYMTKVVGFDNIKGALIGVCLGLVIIYFLKSTLLFLVIVLFFVFLTFYLKIFPTIYFSSAFMTTFVLVFSVIKTDFLELIIYRVTDVLIGFLVAFGVSFIFFRKIGEQKLTSNLLLVTLSLSKLTACLIHKNGNFATYEKAVLKDLNTYKQAVLEGDKRDYSGFKASLEIYKNLSEINSLIINLKDYIKLLKHSGWNDYMTFTSDINIIKTRFEMIEKKVNKLPYYFYDTLDDKVISEDKKIIYLIKLIADRQNKIANLV